MSSDVLKKLERYATTDPDEPEADTKQSDTKEAPAFTDSDIELANMQFEADLLGLIQQDTGEQGHGSGDRIDFKKCPICGHHDDFSFYPKKNTWHCYSASNNGITGGSYIKYLLATGRAHSDAEAVKLLREATGHEYEGGKGKGEGKSEGAPTTKDGSNSLLLPRWNAVHAAEPPARAPVLIDGVLRRGHVGLISGKAKAGKSWAALQLAVTVATGGSWLGRFECARGKVLYIDPELDYRSFEGRMHRVCQATGASYDEVEARVSKWCLRGVMTTEGKPPTIVSLAHDLSAAGERFDLIIIDSAACFLDGDENSSHDVRAFTNQVLRICESTGAAALIVQHMGKGLAGDRDAADRTRGSSVWADAPDVTMTITETFPDEGELADHLEDGERALLLECAGMREFPSFAPVRIIYRYPVHRYDADGITDGWKPKTTSGKGGRASGNTRKAQADIKRAKCEAILLAHFLHSGTGRDGIPAKEAADLCTAELETSVTSTTLKTYFEESELVGVYQKSPRRAVFYPLRLPPKEADTEDTPAIHFAD